MLHSIRRHVLPLDIYYSLKICHYRIAMCSQDIIRGYNSLLTLVRLNLNIVPQDSNTIMKYVIQDLFITFSPLWSSSDQKTTTSKFTIFKISDYQGSVPSFNTKEEFLQRSDRYTILSSFLRKIFNISIDDVIGKPLDITKYVCPRSGRSVKRLYLYWSRDYLKLNSYFRIYGSYNFPNEMWGILLFRN